MDGIITQLFVPFRFCFCKVPRALSDEKRYECWTDVLRISASRTEVIFKWCKARLHVQKKYAGDASAFQKLSQRSLEVALLASLPANLTEKHSREQPDMPGDEIKPELII